VFIALLSVNQQAH